MTDITPTDPESEQAAGRVPLWLDPADIRWISRHCCCPPDASQEERDRCGRIRFRASNALYKHGHGR
ncbi:hypothetical protein [Streptomyces sp. NPDC058751]|uniref:hypothetical protein n=1 Tax=Streptomyces sp. NPDC058751 TaxID=3346623 RepID=UPI0036869BC5